MPDAASIAALAGALDVRRRAGELIREPERSVARMIGQDAALLGSRA